MSNHTALLLASVAIASVASPAFGQDHHVDDRYATVQQEVVQDIGIVEEEIIYETVQQEVVQDIGAVAEEAYYEEEWAETEDLEAHHHSAEYDHRGHHGGNGGHGRHERREHRSPGAAHAPGLGYTTVQRNQWLAECRYLMAGSGGYYDEGYARYERGPDGALVGGVLGAVAGGIAGNRIADDNRLLGTVVGAGLGGIAGAAIGDALDGDERDYYDDGYADMDREELWAARYCEAYLARHEMSAGSTYAYAQPVMMVPVRVSGGHHASRCRSCDGETVIVEEEVVEIERPAPRRPARRSISRPRPQGDKRSPIN